ncbi:MAG: phospholipase D family protein [Pseudomonadota bacterium]
MSPPMSNGSAPVGGYPLRPLGRCVPLVTAAEGFPAMERLIESATAEIAMGFRVFDPETRLRASTIGQSTAGQTWADLLAAKHREGVAIRIALSDFDALGAPALHEATWRSLRRLATLATPGGAPFEVMAALHPARAGPLVGRALWPAAALALERQRRALNALDPKTRRARFLDRPGLWRHLRLRANGRLVWRMGVAARLHPVTHHHKVLVVDGARAVLGGLDIDERRFDDPGHRRPAEETWHDVSVLVDGPVAADIADFLAARWNASQSAVARRLKRLHAVAPAGAAPLPPVPTLWQRSSLAPAHATDSGIRLLRTLSSHRRAGLGPRVRVREFEHAYSTAIARAETLIYIETQFFRSQAIAEALAEAAARRPGLGLILVLPAVPEAVAFEGKTGLAERLGAHLEATCLERIAQAFGARCALLSPVRPVPVRPVPGPAQEASLHGAEIVYVHAKLMIVDRTLAIVGSANLNGRSLRWDTEAGVLVEDAPAVRRLEQAMLAHWHAGGQALGLELGAGAAARWRALAEATAAQPPAARQGFLVPYDVSPARALGHPVPGIPDELV